MKAVDVEHREDGPRLVYRESPDVSIQSDQVIVDIHSTAVNRADLAQARGSYPPPKGESAVLGLEMAGVVSALGSDTSKWKRGDRVFSLLGGGGYAEQVAVHEDLLLEIPEYWGFHDAAAILEAWLTAYVNLFLEGQLHDGEVVLIHAGASGVGTAAIQLAKSVGAFVIITAGNQEKITACQQFGADLAINYKTSDFRGEVFSRLEGGKVDLILDPVGGSYLESNIEILGEFGRLISIGLLGGNLGALDMAQLLSRRLRLIGSRLRSRPLAEKIRISQGFWERFEVGFEDRSLQPVIDTVFPIEEAQAAHDYVRSNRNIGKVILSVRR